MRVKVLLSGLFSAVVAWGIWQTYPILLFYVGEWQRSFNLALSASLNALTQNQLNAGLGLMSVSFLYGVFHAVGPGHGKFILSSYLSFEQTKLPQAIKLTLLSSLVQGIVAISLVSVIVVLFSLSRSYFNLTLQWVERGSYLMMLLFGLYWLYQSRGLLLHRHKRLKIRKISQISQQKRLLVHVQSVPHHSHCGCGHKHMPSSAELSNAGDWKSQFMLILSIGLRPCSGAILILFLAYTLDLYIWGVFSALVMALGTGLSLTLFACIILFSRQKALQFSKWYLSGSDSRKIGQWLKLLAGGVMIFFALTLLHGSYLENVPNLLFKR